MQLLRNLQATIGNPVSLARQSAKVRAQIYAATPTEEWSRIINANSTSADLKRTAILQGDGIRAFATPILPLTVFCTVLAGIRLEGTNKVAVPFHGLETAASTDFDSEQGYVISENLNSDAKTVTVDKRKYQSLGASSSEISRLPHLDLRTGFSMKAEKLGIDCSTDVFSVVTAANFGAAVLAEDPSALDSDNIADLKGVADDLGWPVIGRALVLNTANFTSLLKDPGIKAALAFGDNDPIRNGRIGRLYGFDLVHAPQLPSNGENLTGFICVPSAVLCAFAPIPPADLVRGSLARYEQYMDPITGATFEYRGWGDPNYDKSKETLEVNYGYALGNPAALKRICSA